MAAGSQFHPPSGHCQAIRDPARERTRGSAARPSRQQAARAFPSMEAWARASPPIAGRAGPACQPGQDVTGRGDRARLARGNGQFGQGHQPPVRPGPLAVGVHAEPAVASLAGQQRGHLGAGEHLAGVVIGVLAEQVAAGHQPDGRLAAVQQPGHGGVRPRVHARPSQAALTRFTIRRSRGSPVWRFRQAM